MWERIGPIDLIILTTARESTASSTTERSLDHYSLRYDAILYNLGNGERILINDEKPATDDHPPLKTAYAVNVKRDEGFFNRSETSFLNSSNYSQ